MSLNKANGNMYPDMDFTWNPIKGKCSHDCSYCYMKDLQKRYKHNPTLRLDEKCFQDDLGENNHIFVGSSTDMFAQNVDLKWILQVTEYCIKYDKNIYLFQTKNPHRFRFLSECQMPSKFVLGVTIESNRPYNISNAPSVENRIINMKSKLWDKMVSIEPILDFDLMKLVNAIHNIKPIYVSIGADSKKSNLPEPPEEKIIALVRSLLNLNINVKIKPNLKRLAPSLFPLPINGVFEEIHDTK